MPTLRLVPASTEDYRRLAERNLPRFLFDYIDGGAYQERTLRANVEDLHNLKLNQRVMRDVSQLDTRAQFVGENSSMPVALAPIGMGGMMARRAEVQAVQAADAIGIPFCLSTVAICSLEEVAKAARRPFWFQLYMLRDRGAVRELLQRARAVGVSTLVFTVDLAVVGARYRDVRNGMGGGTGLMGRLRGGLYEYLTHPRWLANVALAGKPHIFGNLSDYVPKATTPGDFKAWVDAQFDPSVTWKDIERLRADWPGKLVIKGVLSPEDALAAANAGADAVIVSNHGGRQLDGAASTITALPPIADALAGRTEVLMDGGVRSGQDVARALASGARAVMIGRPWIWALAARGRAGLQRLLATFAAELRVTMALTGAPTIADLNADILAKGRGAK
ncbi:MAG: L-lactate dehydrogenase [Hyphomonadaceae bacterium]